LGTTHRLLIIENVNCCLTKFLGAFPMGSKKFITPEEIKNALNVAMAQSFALGGDCQRCQVKRIAPVTEEDAIRLGRNWNVDIVNDKCIGDCMATLEQTAKDFGSNFDALWS
jgi:hypothetical protein